MQLNRSKDMQKDKRRYNKIIKLKKIDIDIDEYVQKAEFQKDVLGIISSQRSFMKKGQ